MSELKVMVLVPRPSFGYLKWNMPIPVQIVIAFFSNSLYEANHVLYRSLSDMPANVSHVKRKVLAFVGFQ